MIYLWLLFIATFILSAVGMLPSQWYTKPTAWFLARHRAKGEQALTRELARVSQGAKFTPSVSFLPFNLGVAVDKAAGKLFLATREGGKLHGALVNLADVQGITEGERRDSGFYDYYIDVALKGVATPWRILVGEQPELAAEVKTALEQAL